MENEHPKAGLAPKDHRGAKQVTTAERARLALEYRKAGLSYRAIAAKIGWRSQATAFKVIQKALKELVAEAAAEVKTLENERLDRLQVGLWERASAGDINAVRAILAIMERRARLNGLDAPAKSEVDLDINDRELTELSDEELINIARSGGFSGSITPSLCPGTPD